MVQKWLFISCVVYISTCTVSVLGLRKRVNAYFLTISVENVNNALRNGIQNEITGYIGLWRRFILVHIFIGYREGFEGCYERLFDVSQRQWSRSRGN